ncbi:hypothetical protein OTU49_013621, partial [Cherax quadricarinatus]
VQELEYGVQHGDEAMVLDALARGADVTITTKMDNEQSGCLLCLAGKVGHAQLVPHLLAAGLNVNGSGESLLTPIYVAARHGHDQVLRELLKAQPNLEDKKYEGENHNIFCILLSYVFELTYL